MTINKRAGRSIKKNIAFYIISIILTMLTSMVIVAAVSTGHTLTKVVDDFVKDYKAEDAEFVTYQPLSDADMEKLEQEYDVILEHSRYKDVNVESGDLKGATIRVFPMPEKLNLCEGRDGHEPGDGEALLTHRAHLLHHPSMQSSLLRRLVLSRPLPTAMQEQSVTSYSCVFLRAHALWQPPSYPVLPSGHTFHVQHGRSDSA